MSKKKILNPSSGRNPEYLSNYESYTHKECTKCKNIKPVSEFSKTTQKNRIGWAYRSYCKPCGNQQTREYAASNKEKRNERLRTYRKNNTETVRLIDKRKKIKRVYGLTIEGLLILKDLNKNRCWICHREGTKLFVDHCHTSKKVRGILCPRCNSYLGVIKDSLDTVERIKLYLLGKCHADVLLELANR